MEYSTLLKRPVLTEKTYKEMQNGTYTFVVVREARKHHIRHAVEFIFNVKVASVRTRWQRPKSNRVGRFTGLKPGYKKATVKLASGQINFFPEDKTSKTKPVVRKDAAVTSKPVITEAEKRAAAKIARATSQKNKLTSSKSTPEVIAKKQVVATQEPVEVTPTPPKKTTPKIKPKTQKEGEND